ncbi:Peptidase M24 [Dillenia turbinata]|uniref:Peptidase M24 n=1 Tax=Dillenia turbinata TaxID=194707 RepID=A0AAN8Z276_9MAGN
MDYGPLVSRQRSRQVADEVSEPSTVGSSYPRKESSVRTPLIVVSKRISGLEGAITIRRRPPLRRGRVSPRLPVPDHIPRPPYRGSNVLPELSSEPQIHDSEGSLLLVLGGKYYCILYLHAAMYSYHPSVTANEIDKAVHLMMTDSGAYLSSLGYGGFPKSGYHGDTSTTFLCGDVSVAFKRLVEVTEECMERGFAVCKDGASFKKIGKRIWSVN